MKVNVLGFKIKLAKGVSVGDFYQQLEAIEDKEVKLRSRTTILYTDVVENLICGLVLSFKTNKKSLVSERDDDGDLRVTKNTLKKKRAWNRGLSFLYQPRNAKGIVLQLQRFCFSQWIC